MQIFTILNVDKIGGAIYLSNIDYWSNIDYTVLIFVKIVLKNFYEVNYIIYTSLQKHI